MATGISWNRVPNKRKAGHGTAGQKQTLNHEARLLSRPGLAASTCAFVHMGVCVCVCALMVKEKHIYRFDLFIKKNIC